jgi:hypothetical protein
MICFQTSKTDEKCQLTELQYIARHDYWLETSYMRGYLLEVIITSGFKGQTRMCLICAPKKINKYNDSVYRDECHKLYYIMKCLTK